MNKPGARTLRGAIRGLRRPRWLRERIAELEHRAAELEHRHQLTLHEIAVAREEAPPAVHLAAETLACQIKVINTELNCLILGWRQLQDVSQRVKISYPDHLPPK